MLLSDKYPFLTNYFTQALTATDRALPQSIVFYGNDFESQYTLSKEIARLLNCTSDKDDNCECLNCKWIRDDAHPAVMTISKVDNKPEDDDSKTVISIKQAQLIKENMVTESEFHRVFIFCDRDDNGNIQGLNQLNFQAETANSLLKIIEEPQPRTTFIFLTRYIDDILPTIISRSYCFFVPEIYNNNIYDYKDIEPLFGSYPNLERKDVFDISEKLVELTKEIPVENVLAQIQNFMLNLLKTNPKFTSIIEDIKIIEDAKRQSKLGIKPINIFDDLCLKIIK